MATDKKLPPPPHHHPPAGRTLVLNFSTPSRFSTPSPLTQTPKPETYPLTYPLTRPPPLTPRPNTPGWP